MSQIFKNKILLTGGGTGGSVAPLLAVVDELGHKDYEYLWLGTRKGPEREMVAGVKLGFKTQLNFKAIAAAKLRRYFSLRTLLAPVWLGIGFVQAFFIIMRWRPQWIISAGGFVSVPVVWAGWILRRKILIHQQDARPGLANKLMAPFARVITVAFEKSLEDYGKKVKWIGNPVRSMKYEVRNKKFFNLKSDLPIVLILGGGTGAKFINNLVMDSLSELTKICQIIHVTGKGKQPENVPASIANYCGYEFLSRGQMAEAQTRSDIVISRCGMSTLSELSYLGKPVILIPIPESHQVENALIFEEQSAAIVLDQPVLEKTFFINKIKELLADKEMQKQLGKNIGGAIKKGAAKELAKIISEN